MNYLAHAFVSKDDPLLNLGNILGDWVKGNRLEVYSLPVQQGISLHRSIDRFTDSHAIIQELKLFFRPHAHLGAGVFVDIFWDYALAHSPEYLSESQHRKLSNSVYALLDSHRDYMNDRMQSYFGHMKSYDWLFNYRFESGIYNTVVGLSKRYPRLGNGAWAFDIWLKLKDRFQDDFSLFFPQLMAHCEKHMQGFRE